MISVRQISARDAAYSQLSATYGSVFSQPEWLDLYGDHLVLNGLFNLNNDLIGAFNVFKAVKFGLTYLIVPPYSPSNGLFFINPAENNSNRITYEKAVHEAICQWFTDQKGFLKMSAFPPGVNDIQPYFWKGFKVVPNYTYRLKLDKDEDSLFAAMTSEKRKSVRKAQKDSVEIRPCYDYKVVKQLVLKTFDRKEKRVNHAYLDRILGSFATKENSFAFVAYINEKPAACTFCVHDSTTSYYLFGGYDNGNKHHGAGPGCMWNAILHAKKIGLNIFDFEGSMLPEVEKYFREFGGDLVPYYTIQKGWLPVEMLLKLKMRNRF
jgi:lipid II:glycine glycyltransferase (peptidoglycan interpeptide bridge formation enzyme)